MGTTLQLLRLTQDEAQRLISVPNEVDEFIDREDHATVDVDKAWDGLSFLLTRIVGRSGNFLIDEGRRIGRWKWLGPSPRLMLPTKVTEVATLMQGVSVETLRTAYDPATMIKRRVYPNIWSIDPRDTDALDYVSGIYVEVRSFVAEVAARGDAIILDLG